MRVFFVTNVKNVVQYRHTVHDITC